MLGPDRGYPRLVGIMTVLTHVPLNVALELLASRGQEIHVVEERVAPRPPTRLVVDDNGGVLSPDRVDHRMDPAPS